MWLHFLLFMLGLLKYCTCRHCSIAWT